LGDGHQLGVRQWHIGGELLRKQVLAHPQVHRAASERELLQGGAEGAAREPVGQLESGLAGVGGEPGDVDQGLDAWVAAGGVGDYRAAVGVADQDDRSSHGVHYGADVGGVAGQAAQRVGGCDHRVAVASQPGNHAVPA